MTSGPEIATALDSTDPAEGLRAVVSLRILAEQLEQLHVDHARGLGWSWQDIALVLGVSKQAVHKKYGRGVRPTRRSS